jgi:hypothetical protein
LFGGVFLGRVLLLLWLLVLIRLKQVGGVKEGALFLSDVHKRGLNARKHCLDPPQVDVADCAPVIGTIHQQLYESVIFQDGHASFALASVDQDLTLQV